MLLLFIQQRLVGEDDSHCFSCLCRNEDVRFFWGKMQHFFSKVSNLILRRDRIILTIKINHFININQNKGTPLASGHLDFFSLFFLSAAGGFLPLGLIGLTSSYSSFTSNLLGSIENFLAWLAPPVTTAFLTAGRRFLLIFQSGWSSFSSASGYILAALSRICALTVFNFAWTMPKIVSLPESVISFYRSFLCFSNIFFA